LLEPCERKLSCTVLRGEGGSNTADLLDKPSDLSQREGRIIRQGNQNSKVKIFRYVTENTFDSYHWSILERKQHFISQVVTSKFPTRTCEDVDAAELSYAELKAIAAGEESIREIMSLETDIKKLKIKQSSFYSDLYQMQDKLHTSYPSQLQNLKSELQKYQEDAQVYQQQQEKPFSIVIGTVQYTERKKAGDAILALLEKVHGNETKEIGNFQGFSLSLKHFLNFGKSYSLILERKQRYPIELGTDSTGNIIRLQNKLNAIPKIIQETEQKIMDLEKAMQVIKEELQKPFPYEQELQEKSSRLKQLQQELDNKNKISSSEEKSENKTSQEKESPFPETSPSQTEKNSIRNQLKKNAESIQPFLSHIQKSKGEIAL